MGNYFYRSCTSRVWLKLTEIIVTHYENNRATLFPIHSWLSGIDRLKWRVFTLRSCKQCSRAVSGICSGRSYSQLTNQSASELLSSRRESDCMTWIEPSGTCEREASNFESKKFQNFLCGFSIVFSSKSMAWVPRPRSRCEHRMQNNLSLRSSISWVLRCYWPVISWNCTSVDLNAPVRWNYNFSFFLFSIHSRIPS